MFAISWMYLPSRMVLARHYHDNVQQNICALKSVGYEPFGPFITSVLELKLDANTMFKWQWHSQESTDMPHYSVFLEFLNLWAHASETSTAGYKLALLEVVIFHNGKPFATNTADTSPNCIVCKKNIHLLYACMNLSPFPTRKCSPH